MGYHITLERRNADAPITLAEWRQHVETSSELSWAEVAQDGVSPTDTHSASLRDEPEAVLHFSAGSIWTKTPSPRLISYLVSISPHFDGVVRGDEGEIYATQSDCPTEEEWASPVPQKTFWQRECTPGNIVRMLILFGIAAFLIYKYISKPAPTGL